MYIFVICLELYIKALPMMNFFNQFVQQIEYFVSTSGLPFNS